MNSPIIVPYQDAYAATLNYFNGDELATSVFLDKYALKDNNQNLLESTPKDMHLRIAKELARVEKSKFKQPLSEEEIFSYLDGFKRIVPQGSPMYGIGNPYQYVTLSNCYVLESPLDSYGSIHRTDEQLSQISKRRGGCGIDISNLRPAGTPTKNAARTSTGIVSFMERYSNSIREVGQAGRRGALMLTISVHHPQILDFVKAKKDLKKVTGANISIRYSNEFLSAVEKDKEYELRFPVDSITPEISIKISAKSVWVEIVKTAWESAEPGSLFWQTILDNSPADCYSNFGFTTISTNPCSELPLSVLDSCRIFLQNLFSYVKNAWKSNAYFDFEEFSKDAVIMQRLMDDVIDLELECIERIIDKIKKDPEPEKVKNVELDLWKQIKYSCYNGRRTGSGITALGDTLAALGIKYGSEKSIKVTGEIYKTLKLSCYRSSVDMAKELGPFPVWKYALEKDNLFLNRIKEEDEKLYNDMKKYGRRNIALLTTAPAGSVSILTQTTSGIEPLFMTSYKRRKKINPNDSNAKVDFVDQSGDSWQEFTIYHSKLEGWKKVIGKNDEKESPYYGCCAEDLDWKQRVKLQAEATKHIDHAISSTINLPEDVTTEKVAEIYETAWKLGCKGITIYRKNCRSGVLIEDKDTKTHTEGKIKKNQAPKRPSTLPCGVHTVKVKNREYFVLVGLLENDPYEIFAGENTLEITKNTTKGELTKLKRGMYKLTLEDGYVHSSINKNCPDEEEAITRLVSTSLRHGADISFIVHQLEKIQGDMFGFSKAIARVLKKYVPDGTKISGETCQSCNQTSLVRQEGCVTCLSCGWTKCS